MFNLSIIQHNQTISSDISNITAEHLNKNLKRFEQQQILLQQQAKSSVPNHITPSDLDLFFQSNVENQFIENFNPLGNNAIASLKSVYSSISPNVLHITPEIESKVLSAWNLLNRYHNLLTTNSLNLYIFASEQFSLFYWPGLNINSISDFDNLLIKKQNLVTKIKHDQANKSYWSEIYISSENNKKTISLFTPIYVDGAYWFTIGQDFSLEQIELLLLKNDDAFANQHLITIDNINTDTETRNLIDKQYNLSKQELYEKIILKQSLIKPNEQGESSTRALSQISFKTNNQQALVHAQKLGELPLWLVTLAPFTPGSAITVAEFIFLFSLIMFLIVSIFLYVLLKRKVKRPIQILNQACNQIKQGNYHLETTSGFTELSKNNDDTGLLAQRYKQMSTYVKESLESLEDEITERTLTLDHALQEQKAIFNNAYIGILLIKNGKVTNCNKRFEEITGYKIVDVINQSQTFLKLDDRDILADMEWLKDKIFEHGSYMVDCECKHKNGNLFWCSTQFKAIDTQNLDKGIVLTIVDITKRRNAELLLAREARIDGLTGIGNRRAFDEAIVLACRRAQREQVEITLAMIDVDLFKKFNDTYGHVIGDEALIKVAKQLEKVTRRPYELAARYGGEEFALIFHGSSDIEAILNKVLDNVYGLKIENRASEHQFLSISIGAVTIKSPKHQKIPTQWLVKQADKMLYQAKRQGRNQIQYQYLESPPEQVLEQD
ncbi:diguanylate cyclase [Catenovulum sp. 2E275]|uniref:diguanylate cyclase n=1 Tax=Catenovulum sp. 2E275 TaxID=2980497 RepID=UPI0021D262FB|nr:diguanylate cyclase [Catenovulum sp. 2E275]MCU4674520.1 diguanylate cyclase [Catenovulum sp. 2E275]